MFFISLIDPSGAVTTVLLSASSYVKDNRLLPRGFEKATAEEFIAVRGAATEDADFVGSGDRIRYQIATDGTQGPFVVEAELWYQPIGFRWAHNLGDVTAEEIDRFVGYYEEMADSSAVVVTSARSIAE